MADALISVLLEPLISITAEFLKQKVKLVKGFKEDVSSIKSKLEAINTVLGAAEEEQLKDPVVRRWLDQLKDVSYDIDNQLDKWNTEILKSTIQKQNAPASKKKVCFPLPSSCFCVSQPKKVGILLDVAHEIKKLNETLERIDEEKRKYSFETTKVVPNKRRETTSTPDSIVYGRDANKNDLISKLLGDSSSQGREDPDIILIEGMGGIGKTALAQLAFNDDKVRANFDERVWVCVSDPFDGIVIGKKILEVLKVDNCQNLNALESVSGRIRESIEGKKFLLVLDDVWTEDHGEWEQFIKHFRSGAAGSMLLVTTRKTTVAIMMGVPTHMIINLEQLSDEHCWLIFSRLAFSERNSEERQQLEEIGREIAKKCKGLPLQAKTLGALMRSKETKRDWEDVLSNQIWKSQDDKIKHFAPFLLSYYVLPPLEKRCFSYCSVFPKDYEFRRDELIEMWMSQGYFNSNEDPENEGRNCFENLIFQSFFQDFQTDDDDNIVACKMHDVLHDLAQFLTKNECVTEKVDEGNTQPRTVEKKVRHLTLLLPADGVEFLTSMLTEGNLHSLFILRLQWSANALRLPAQTSGPLRYLRTLNISKCGISQLPGQLIGQLGHLRYLNLSKNGDLKELPDEVCDLCNLQTLILIGCFQLERLPKGMGKLVNLRHIHISECDHLKGLPKGIGRLNQLRTLDRVVIAEYNDEKYLSMGDLEKMNQLQFESVSEITRCEILKNSSEVQKLAGLVKRGNQVKLCLGFHLDENESKEDKEDDELKILEALQPHPSLKSLEINGYHGANLSPKWMTSLHNLTRLQFYGCQFFETFPPLGMLPSLEVLEIFDNGELRKIGGEVGIISTTSCTTSTSSRISSDDDINVAKGGVHHISFPKIKHLTFVLMGKREEWEGCESTTNMPCLESLYISDCNNLKSLPQFLNKTPLNDLTIGYCYFLSESFQSSKREWAHISHVPNIKIDGKVVKLDGNCGEEAFLDADFVLEIYTPNHTSITQTRKHITKQNKEHRRIIEVRSR